MIRDAVLCDGRFQKVLPRNVSCGRNQLGESIMPRICTRRCVELVDRCLTCAKNYTHGPN